MVFSGSLFYVWSRLEAVNLSYEISRQARLRKKLIQLNERLTLEVATLKSPDRIGKIAREDLGMVVSRKGQTKVIANGY
jgi:cell division protein FtsL